MLFLVTLYHRRHIWDLAYAYMSTSNQFCAIAAHIRRFLLAMELIKIKGIDWRRYLIRCNHVLQVIVSPFVQSLFHGSVIGFAQVGLHRSSLLGSFLKCIMIVIHMPINSFTFRRFELLLITFLFLSLSLLIEIIFAVLGTLVYFLFISEIVKPERCIVLNGSKFPPLNAFLVIFMNQIRTQTSKMRFSCGIWQFVSLDDLIWVW